MLKRVLLSLIIFHINVVYAVAKSNVPHNKSASTTPEIGFRIVHGKATKDHAYPWMTLIRKKGKMHCGGSLISHRHVLTAAHCLVIEDITTDELTAMLTVILGAQKLLKHDLKQEELRHISHIKVHEEYTQLENNDENDIGILTLKDAVLFTKIIQRINLATPDSDVSGGEKAIVTGWGVTVEDGPVAKTLQEADMKILSHEDCLKTEYGKHIRKQMVCGFSWDSTDSKNLQDACQGDSGGPLMHKRAGKFELIGVVSWGVGCAQPNIPGVYARVASYYKWIMSHIAAGE